MAENKKVMEEEAVDTKETKAEQTCEETKDTKAVSYTNLTLPTIA